MLVTRTPNLAWGRMLLLAAATLLLPSCSNLNPLNWWRGSPAPKLAELQELGKSIPVRLQWQAAVGAADVNSLFSPAIVGGHVYAADSQGSVLKLDSTSGKLLWRINVGRSLSGGVGADANLVMVGTGEGEVIAMESGDGAVRWRARVSSEVLSAPAMAGDVVVVRSADSRIFALDARDGKRRWVYQRAAQPLTVRTGAGVIVSRGNVYAGFAGGKLASIAMINGALRWEATVATPRGATELERVSDVVGLPWLTEREICAVAYQGRVGCFDLANGTSLWARGMSSVSGLDADTQSVFVSEDRGAVQALDRVAGTSLWRQERLTNRNLSAPLVLGSEVIVGDVQGYVHVMSRETGAFVARVATDGSPIVAPPQALAGGFLIQSRKGGLFAFSLK